MKKWVIVLTVLTLLEIGSRLAPVLAQSPQPYWFSVTSAQHTLCTVVPSVTSYCYADDGAFVSIHGAAWAPMGGGGAVTSVFGRTGDVKATAGDYAFAQIASPPPLVNSFAGRTGIVVPVAGDYGAPASFSCTQFSLNNSATPPLAANGCK